MANSMILDSGSFRDIRRITLAYDCLSPEEAEKIIDALSTDDELCRELDYCEDVNITFDSIDHGDGNLVRTICMFVDGVSVTGSDEYTERMVEEAKHGLDFIRGRIKHLTGID